ncbi:MAG TPA: hypothetical protein PLU87_14575 [Sedimentisphaerales bacterium]|nr:hypothetical protein [Sedimentisphaerales bacterium]HRS12945.1 hypothetical protein [Sedimentisphaerales bacterium]HRV49558.1 hypothetical protein [Sedimentisphaerales bacterium]
MTELVAPGKGRAARYCLGTRSSAGNVTVFFYSRAAAALAE